MDTDTDTVSGMGSKGAPSTVALNTGKNYVFIQRRTRIKLITEMSLFFHLRDQNATLSGTHIYLDHESI
jgi:hypothetical protein